MENNEINNQKDAQNLSYTERLISFFTDFNLFFTNIKVCGNKAIDWIIPLILVSFIAIFINLYYMNSNYFKVIILQKQMARMQEQLQEQVDKKIITQKKADETMEQIQKNTEDYIEKSKSPVVVIFQIVSSLISMLIVMAIIAVFFKFCYQLIGKISIEFSLMVYLIGITFWFSLIDFLLSFIISIATGNIISSLALGNLLGIENFHIMYWINKISIFGIISYIWIAKGISVIKEIEFKKSLMLTFGFWFLGNLLFYVLAINIPFLKNFL